MADNTIKRIIIHCAATPNGKRLGNGRQTAAQRIDDMHARRGFARRSWHINAFNPHLRAIGYHYIIDTDGTLESGRAEGETGAHVKGYNTGSIGICMVGTTAFTRAQWAALTEIVRDCARRYPDAIICGHRDLSPDLNGDGKITANEWIKLCPGFDTAEWLEEGMQPLPDHTTEEVV